MMAHKSMINPEAKSSMFLNSVKEDHEVAFLDPLCLDGQIERNLPVMNTNNDSNGLVKLAKYAVEKAYDCLPSNTIVARAVTRDLGFITASLRKNGIDYRIIPIAEDVLLKCAALTGEVPRDTVFSYGPRNPQDSRMRTFTGLQEERFFISSFNQGMSELPNAITNLVEVRELSIYDPEFSVLINGTKEPLERMVSSIVEVKKRITPEVFTYDIRPYFPTMEIGGIRYAGPGGAQMPMLIIDYLLWGVTKMDNPEYRHYFEDNVQYLPPCYRDFLSNSSHYDIISRVIQESSKYDKKNHEAQVNAVVSLNSLELFINSLLKFRYPHTKLAKDNMQIRPSGSLGSGGYQADMLDNLLDYSNIIKANIKNLRGIITI